MLRVMTYNVLANAYVEKLHVPDEAQAHLDPASRRARVVERVVAAEADVICLQEVEDELWHDLTERLSPAGYGGVFERRSESKLDGVAVLWHLPGHRAETRVVRFEELPDAKPVYRLAIVCAFTPKDGEGGHPFTVACTHFAWQSPRTPDEPSARLHEAKQLAEACRDAVRPLVLCGDLNAEPDSEEVRVLLDMGLTESHDPHSPTSAIFGRPAKIDYLMATSELRAASLTTPNADVTRIPSGTEPSDHLPLVTDFEFAK